MEGSQPPAVVRMINGVTTALAGVAGAALVAMLLLTVINIGLRLFSSPYAGTFELVSFLSVIVVGLSLAVAQRYKTHVSIDILVSRFSTRTQLIIGAFITVLSMVVFFLIARELISYSLNLQEKGSVSDSLRWPYWPLGMVLAVGIFGLVLALLADLIQIFRNLKSAHPESIW